MTYRERREARAKRLREWADKRERKAGESFGRAHEIGDQIPFGQPILVGHHSEKRARRDADRIHSAMDKGVEHTRKAQSMSSRADEIDRQLDRSIYSDDDNAIEALRERIAKREEEAELSKRVNAAYRKGGIDAVRELGLKDSTVATIERTMAQCSWLKVPLDTKNPRANIRRDKQRIEEIEARQRRSEAAEEAGGVIVEGDKYVRVTFAEKPARELLTELKAAGFRWGGGHWFGERDRLPTSVIA